MGKSDALIQGKWFMCTCDTFEGEIHFCIRTTGFRKIDISEVDDPTEMSIDDGQLWLLGIEVINISKSPIAAWHITDKVILLDQDDFAFKTVQDQHLTYSSQFAESNGLHRFIDSSNCPPLQPKIRSAGALAFLLPPDQSDEFRLSVDAGNMAPMDSSQPDNP